MHLGPIDLLIAAGLCLAVMAVIDLLWGKEMDE